MHKVSHNKQRSVWCAAPNSRLFDQFRPFVPTEAYITMFPYATLQDAKGRIKEKVSWTEESGFGVFGSKKDILNAFGKLRYHMFSDTSVYSNELRQYGSCRMLVMYAVPGTELSAIIGVDYVYELSPKFKTILNTLENVVVVLAGNGYHDEYSPIDVALEQIEEGRAYPILEQFKPYLKQHCIRSNEMI